MPSISQKYVELLHDAVPRASRLAIVGGPKNPAPKLRLEMQTAAQQLGITVAFNEIAGSDDIDSILASVKQDGAGGIIVALDRLTSRFVSSSSSSPSSIGYQASTGPVIMWRKAV